MRQTSNVLATIDRVRTTGLGVVFIAHNVRHITAEQLQAMMAGGQELATLEGSLGGTV